MIERYTIPEIGRIWEDENKYRIWLDIEILACEAQAKLGKIPEDAVAVIKEKADFEVKRILEIEAEVHHDVIAFLTNVAEYVGEPSRYVHYGMTSSDVLDTTLSVQMKQAGELILTKLDAVIDVLKKQSVAYKDAVMVGRSHGVHAEPLTFGFKLAVFYSEMLRNRERLLRAIETVSVGKISGAVGTFAHMEPFVEEYVCEKLGLKAAAVSTQVLQRDRHAEYLSTMAVIAASLEKISTEIRHLQRTEVLEVEEPFGSSQKGSSAMPHKKNPIVTERITGMARLLRGHAMAALENVALWHERDISHSSVERVIMPDATITLYYMLEKTRFVLDGMQVNTDRMMRNLESNRGLVFSQSILLNLIDKGVSREDAYRLVQRNALEVYHNQTTLLDELCKDDEVLGYLPEEKLRDICNLENRLKNIKVVFERLELL
ncbi:MAG: adenylosuccinate lyase [Calditrichota bacterium]